MKITTHLGGKPLSIEISTTAKRALEQREVPLLVEMELYFSCLVRKKVRFYDQPAEDNDMTVRVTDVISVEFRPVMTQTCNIHDFEDDKPPVTDFPIRNPKAYTPHWLHLDYQHGQWSGEFGYNSRR